MKLILDDEDTIQEFLSFQQHRELFNKFMTDFNEFVSKHKTHAQKVSEALHRKIETEEKRVANMESELSNLKSDIEADKITSPVENKIVDENPFIDTTPKWSKSHEKSIIACASPNTPESHRTYTYLKKILPHKFSDGAIRAKLKRMGYVVKKGVICKK